jgi:hypothetical protein
MALMLRTSDELTRPMPPEIFDEWLSSGGRARRVLLEPLRERLRRPSTPPSSFLRSIEPLRWLIQKGRGPGLPLDREGFLKPPFAINANRRFGFTSPETLDGQRSVLEIDQLLTLGHVIRAFESKDGRAKTTMHGRCFLSDNITLWETAAAFICALPPEGGTIARVWEITLAWLLQPEVDYAPLNDAVIESLGPDDPRPEEEGFEELMTVALFSLYTLARGLDMFTEPDPSAGKPLLNDLGQATACAALRAACVVSTRPAK